MHDDEEDANQLPRERAYIEWTMIDKEHVGHLVGKMTTGLEGQEPNQHIQAAALVVLWCAMHPDLVQMANDNVQMDAIMKRVWTFVQRTLEMVALAEVEGVEGVQ